MEGIMKKILFLMFCFLLALPTFAVCKIDQPCSVTMLDNTAKQEFNSERSNSLNDDFKTELKLENNNLNSETIKQDKTNYNANCQFGICLPERTQSKNINNVD